MDYINCNEVYGQMVINSDKVKENIQGLIQALEYLAEDYDDEKGYNSLSIFIHSLMEENSES